MIKYKGKCRKNQEKSGARQIVIILIAMEIIVFGVIEIINAMM